MYISNVCGSDGRGGYLKLELKSKWALLKSTSPGNGGYLGLELRVCCS